MNKDAAVKVRPAVFAARPDIAKYNGQSGVVENTFGDFVMVFWRGLSCSSCWAATELEAA